MAASPESMPTQEVNDPRGMIYAALKRAQVAREFGRSGRLELLSVLDLVSAGLNYPKMWDGDLTLALKMDDPTERFHHIVSSVVRLLSHNRMWLRQSRMIERGTEFDEAF